MAVELYWFVSIEEKNTRPELSPGKGYNYSTNVPFRRINQSTPTRNEELQRKRRRPMLKPSPCQN